MTEKKNDQNKKFDEVAKKLAEVGEEHKVESYIDKLADTLYMGGRKNGSGIDFEGFELTEEKAKKIAKILTEIQVDQYWGVTNGWSREKIRSFLSQYGHEKDKITDGEVAELMMKPAGIPAGKGLEKIVKSFVGKPLNAGKFIQLGQKISEAYQGALQDMVLRELEPETKDPQKVADYIMALQKYTGSDATDPKDLREAFAKKAFKQYGKNGEN